MSLACEGHAIKLLSNNFNLFNIIKLFIIQTAGFLRRQKLPRHLFFMIGHFH